MFPTDVVILAGARMPFARYTGAFKHTSAIELGACAAREAIRRAGADLYELRRSGSRYGLPTACIGGGQGIAMIVEAVP